MTKPNAAWHLAHPMPPKATLEERMRWHLEHQGACACRSVPPKLREEIARRESAGARDALPPGLSAPARRALAGAGIATLDQLSARSEEEILRLHGMGPKALGTLREALRARGQAFAGEGARPWS